MTSYPRPPAHTQAYVDVLGMPGAMDFLLTFGGGEIYLTTSPKGRSKLEQVIGTEKAIALAEAIPATKVRVPTAKPWIARCLKSEGLPVAEIARRLHTTDVTVRSYLAAGDDVSGATSRRDPRQLSLF